MARKKKDDNLITDGNISDLDEFFKSNLESQELDDVETFISTGSTLLDYAIANKPNGGIPAGRVAEISGAEASGKSLLAYFILSHTQKMGGISIYIDTERAANKEFMVRLGINWKKLIYKKDLRCIEEVFDYIEKVAKVARIKIPDKKVPVVIVWDSVAGTPPKTILEGNYGDTTIGVAARAMSAGLNKLNEVLDEGYITLVCINQLRTKIGVMFGDPETTPHGKALPYYSSVRIKLSGTKKIYEKAGSDRVIGTMCNAKVFKNKVAPNWRSVSFPLMYDYGINDAQSILDYLSDLKIVKTGGAWKTLTVGENDYKFQSPNWREIYNKPDVQKYIKEVLDENMIIKFEGMPDSFNIDAESFMEIDQLKTDVEEKQ